MYVPVTIRYLLFVSLASQCLWHFHFNRLEATLEELSSPPLPAIVRLLSLDDEITAAKILMLRLQAYDNQPGISIPLKDINYDQVIKWLDLILQLDKKASYPLLAAIRFYAEVQDEDKQRKMVRYVSEKFIEDPDNRWQFMAHAVYISKHRIKDMQLAVECAQLLRQHAKGDNVPHWAKQMVIFVLEDMGELEAAKIIIGGLLASGELEDQQQQAFLRQRLEEIEKRQFNYQLNPE